MQRSFSVSETFIFYFLIIGRLEAFPLKLLRKNLNPFSRGFPDPVLIFLLLAPARKHMSICKAMGKELRRELARGRPSNGPPGMLPWDLGLRYVTWQSRIKAAGKIKLASQLTLKQGDYPGLSRWT